MARHADRPLVYFICVGNAMRSQMAEGFLRHHHGERFDAASAGTHPAGVVFPEVVEVMADLGIDIRHHRSEPIDAAVVERAARIVDLGGRARQAIPSAFAARLEEWRVRDPYRQGPDGLIQVRDQIRDRVEALVRDWPA